MPAEMTGNEKNEYDVTAECFRHNQTLIHQSIATYVVFAGPLGAVAVAANFDISIRVLASVVAFVLSGLWYLMTKRLSIYNRSYLDRLTKLEGSYDGFMHKDNELTKTHPWLSFFPGTTLTITTTLLLCTGIFLGFTVYLLVPR